MEEDRLYGYDGPDSERKPLNEGLEAEGSGAAEAEPNAEPEGELKAMEECFPDAEEDSPAAAEEPAAEDAADRYDTQNSGMGSDFHELNGYPNTDSRQYENWGREEYRQAASPAYMQPQRQSSMALASLIMGIIGIVTSCCCYGGLIFGSLGILFALLSKTGDTMEGYAKAGLITSIIALFLAAMAMIFLFGMMSSSLLSGGAY